MNAAVRHLCAQTLARAIVAMDGIALHRARNALPAQETGIVGFARQVGSALRLGVVIVTMATDAADRPPITVFVHQQSLCASRRVIMSLVVLSACGAIAGALSIRTA